VSTDTATIGGQNALMDAFWQAVTPERLNLIVLPTEQCNFRCTYCYEDFLLPQMTAEVAGGIKALLTRRADELKSLQLSWFGGEPTLALDVIEDISRHAQQLVALHPDLRYDADMTTNAYRLNAKLLTRLVDLGVSSYEITLDGPEEMHNRTRLRRDGGESFARIWQNLLEARDTQLSFHVTLRLHVTPDNLEAVERFVPVVRDTFLTDSRFGILFMPVAHLGGPNDNEFDVLPSDSTRRVLRSLSALAQGKSPEEEPAELPAAQMSGVDVCYASKPNSLVIRSDGRVGKCTVGLSEPANSIGRLEPDGTLIIKDELLRRWLRGWETGDWNDLACPRDAFVLGEPEPVLLPMPTVRKR
jgi:uncharacterized protein